MSDQRAILLDEDEAVDAEPWILERYDAAVDQPRKRVCATHGLYDIVYGTEHCWLEGVADGRCRVVVAIVTPLEPEARGG